MAYSLFKTPSRFFSKFPRKDFIVLVVVIGVVVAMIATTVMCQNKAEIAESFSNLAVEVVNACESYPKIISGKVYGNEKCDCAPKVAGDLAEIKEDFGGIRKMMVTRRKNGNFHQTR